jgi:hypothetical protein
MNSLNKLLHGISEAHIVGSKKPIIPPSESDIQNIEKSINDALPVSDRLIQSECTRLQNQGLFAARAGMLEMADGFFREEYLLFHTKNISSEGFLFCKFTYEAAVAYLDYRRNDFDKATARIHEALGICEILENKSQYRSLHLKRVQLLTNLIRLNRTRGSLKEAITMIFCVLNYLEKKSNMIPIATPWGYIQISQWPEITNGLFIVTTNELASVITGCEAIVAGSETLNVRDIFAGAIDHIRPEDTGDCFLSLQAHNWLKAKQALIDGDVEDFLQKVTQMLSKGRADAPFLWYAIIVDLILLCEKLDLPDANLIKQDIAKDAKSWNWGRLPSSWKSLVDINDE